MTPVNALVAKELRAYAVSPVLYVVAAVFLLIFGILSYIHVLNANAQAFRLMQIQGIEAQINLNDLVFRPTFASVAIIMLLILPILTMRLFAEERKLRTFELLLTSPIGVNEIVVGKFLGVLVVFTGILALTLCVPLILGAFSDFDWAPIWSAYLGLVLLGGLFLATGVFASALTENQIVAAFVSFGLLLLVHLLGGWGSILGDTPAGLALSYVSYWDHYDRLVRGLVESKDLVYYISGIVLMLFLAHRVVESQRWK